MGEPHPEEAARRGGGWAWIAATAAGCAVFWAGMYYASLQPWRDMLASAREELAQAEEEVPTPRAERELASTEKELAALLGRWDTTTFAELARQLEAHSVTLRSAQPGEEPGTFVLEVEGSAHGIGQALPEIEKPAPAGRLPAVLYFRKVKQDQALRKRFRLEGVARMKELPVAPPIVFERPEVPE